MVPDEAPSEGHEDTNAGQSVTDFVCREATCAAMLNQTHNIRNQSGSPPRPTFPVFTTNTRVRTSSGSPPLQVFPNTTRVRTSSGSPPPFAGSLWNARSAGRSGRGDHPRFERDSLRNRSLEGRPGSRKHKRHTRSVEIMSSLRKAMAKCGEDANISDAEALELQDEVEWRPSAFYQLLEHEGPARALEVLEAAEMAPPRTRQPRHKDAAQLAKERERQVRHAFVDTLHFVQTNEAARDLLSSLEKEASRAFGSNNAPVALLWMLQWGGFELETRFGAPPAQEMVVSGLSPTFRKVAHQLARSLGLHSESRTVHGAQGSDEKIIAFRPPRSSSCKTGDSQDWVVSFSVIQVISGFRSS